MKAYLSRRYRISASHRLHVDGMSAQENASFYGKCNHPHGHGHNYAIEVTYSGQVNAVTGMVVDLAALDSFVRTRVVERFDLSNLNSLECFGTVVPSTENFCILLHEIFVDFNFAKLESIRVEETRNNSFEYRKGSDG